MVKPFSPVKGRRVAYAISERRPLSAAVLGNKGFCLNELATLGVPVPPGFTVTTSVARAYAQHGTTPKRLEWQKRWGLAQVERETGKTFGDSKNPLLVSVRSGAAVSMPGMMDTILNLGMNPEVVDGLAALHGERFAYDCYRRFLCMFGEVVLGVPRDAFEATLRGAKAASGVRYDSQLDAGTLIRVARDFRNLIESTTGQSVPDDPHVQLALAMEGVMRSWNSERAIEYRSINGIPSSLGTAVNVQSMVYGNLGDTSATGVAFSVDTTSGAAGMTGEFLVNAQGEDVVSGTRTPEAIENMEGWNSAVFNQLGEIVGMLHERERFPVDVEFTVEAGKLYILQKRKAKLTPEAAVTVAVHCQWAGVSSKDQALAQVSGAQLKVVRADGFKTNALETAVKSRLLARGVPASPGAAVGEVVTSSQAAVALAKEGRNVILVRPDTSPDDLKGMVAAVAIVTETGGSTSHAAVVARSLGKPCVVGCNRLNVRPGQLISVDGKTGVVVNGVVEKTQPINKKEVNIFLRWVQAAEAKLWPGPRLAFEMFGQSVPAFRLLNDFYLTDAMAEHAVGTPLEEEAACLRTRIHIEVAERLAMYLAVAVGGEIRHAHRTHRTSEVDVLQREYAIELSGDRGEAQQRSIAKIRTMKLSDHVRYADLIGKVFDNGGWPFSHGGPKWAKIAFALKGFLAGEKGFNHSAFADHAFDLQHNNGSVFGKHPMVAVSDKDRPSIHAMLELKKAAASVPELYIGLTNISDQLSPAVKHLYLEGFRRSVWKYQR